MTVFQNDDEKRLWCKVYVTALVHGDRLDDTAARAHSDEAVRGLRERMGDGDESGHPASVGFIQHEIERAQEVDCLREALRTIADHGYMSARYSTPATIVHSMDWMIETARAALRGEPVPELTDGPSGDESGHPAEAGVHVSAETIAYITAKANEGLRMSTNDYTSEGMRAHLSGFSKGILTALEMIEIAAANSQPRNVGWYYWTGSEWTWTAPD